jgi:pSer/pThr/pTyr-binding forkhead associated (FHA) protein
MPYLRLYTGGTLKQQWQLGDERLSIGRAEDNDVVLPDNGVSKHHAYIEHRDGAYVIVDNDSANGVFVNGEKAKERVLKYWDEIQIFNHQLKFMTSAKLQGDEDGPLSDAAQPKHDATMAVDIKSLGDLDALKKRLTRAYLTPADAVNGQPKHMVDRRPFSIGKESDCNLRTGGWFAPKVAARIEQRDDGVYLIPQRRGKVQVNQRRITAPVALQDGDDVVVRGLRLRYYHRTVFQQ